MAVRPRKQAHKTGGYFSNSKSPYLFMLPAFSIMFVIVLCPIFFSIALSFTDATPLTMFKCNFVGLDNYIKFFTSGDYGFVARAMLILVLITPILGYGLGLYFAVLLHNCKRFNGLARCIVVLPLAVSDVAVTILFRHIFNSDYGVVNRLLTTIGFEQFAGFSWFADANLVFVVLITTWLWKNYPLSFLLLFAGLKSIPTELYDAASVDGANAVQRFWHVTMPGLKYVTASLMMLELVWQLNAFSIVWLLTKGGPANVTSTLTVLAYRNSFVFNKLGYGSAVGCMSMAIALIVCAFYYFKIIRPMGKN